MAAVERDENVSIPSTFQAHSRSCSTTTVHSSSSLSLLVDCSLRTTNLSLYAFVLPADMDSSAGLQECLRMIQGARTDNEMFAALLVVTRLVKAKETSADDRRSLFKAVGFDFLDRLVQSQPPEGCPEYLFQSIALTILGCFATDPEILLHSRMLDKIPLFGDILRRQSAENAEEQAMVDNALDCLEALACSRDGAEQVISRGGTPPLLDLAQLSVAQNSRALSIVLHLLESVHAETLCEKHGGQVARLLRHLATRFKSTQEADKFELLDVLTALLSHLCCTDGLPGQLQAELRRNDAWQTDVCHGLYDVLRSRVKPVHRHSALGLAASLTESCGLQWTSNPAPDVEKRTFLLLLLRLASVEVHLQLEEPPLASISDSVLPMLCHCFQITEAVIGYVVTCEEGVLTSGDIMQFHTCITDVLRSVLAFLSNIAQEENWQSFRLAVLPMVRLVAVWLAEETDMLRDELRACLPLLVEVVKETDMVDDEVYAPLLLEEAELAKTWPSFDSLVPTHHETLHNEKKIYRLTRNY